ncbi:MAG TPA: peptidase, partial [Planctomycetaceae bacterium]|nr:peptidase [Planctomycetaceae bacterium]
ELRRAAAAGVDLIIFEIDSPGGFLGSSTNLAFEIADLEKRRIRTVAYIPKLALSGAAIIALGCDEIYMHPDAQIGDAGPIEMREGGQFEHAPEKVLSHLRQTLRALADRKGRPPALLEAMADKDLLVYQVTHAKTGRTWYLSEEEIHASAGEWIKGPLVPESRADNLLTLDGRRAHQLGLSQPPISDKSELKQRLGIPERVRLIAVGRTWVDTLIFVLNSRPAMFLLFVVGAACVYLELHSMTGFFGIMAALCFSLFFWSRFLGGTAGWLEVVLFVLGLILILLEIFVIPGFGVFGISGGLAVLAALILASQTFVIPHTAAQLEEMTWTLGTLSAAVVCVIAMAVVLSKYLPQMPILNRMILAPPGAVEDSDPDAPRLRPDLTVVSAWPEAQDKRTLVGQRGVAISPLRPAGKAQFGDQFVDVISEGPFVEPGSRIEVIEVSGNRVLVREVPSS